MKQRLGLAAALLQPRDLLVLDEPTNGLDPQGTREVRTLVRELAADGTTVLVSSHLLAEIEQVCTHVGIMSRGRLLLQGDLAELQGAGPGDRHGHDDPGLRPAGGERPRPAWGSPTCRCGRATKLGDGGAGDRGARRAAAGAGGHRAGAGRGAAARAGGVAAEPGGRVRRADGGGLRCRSLRLPVGRPLPDALRPRRGATGRFLRSELRLVFGRRRNQVLLLGLGLVPLLIALADLADQRRAVGRRGPAVQRAGQLQRPVPRLHRADRVPAAVPAARGRDRQRGRGRGRGRQPAPCATC